MQPSIHGCVLLTCTIAHIMPRRCACASTKHRRCSKPCTPVSWIEMPHPRSRHPGVIIITIRPSNNNSNNNYNNVIPPTFTTSRVACAATADASATPPSPSMLHALASRCVRERLHCSARASNVAPVRIHAHTVYVKRMYVCDCVYMWA